MDLSPSLFENSKNIRNELARPVLGTIFLSSSAIPPINSYIAINLSYLSPEEDEEEEEDKEEDVNNKMVEEA